MHNRRDVGLRICMLSAATAVLLSQSLSVHGQSKNVVFSNTKKSPTATSKGTQSSANTAAAAKPASNGKSEVQRQLEMLYEKDGREMPQMNVQPMTPTGPASQVVPASPPNQEDLGPSTVQPTQLSFGGGSSRSRNASSRSYPSEDDDEPLDDEPEKPARKQPIRGFFKKLNPFANKKANSQPPIPPDSLNSIPDVPPSSGSRSMTPPSLQPNPYRYGATGSKSSSKQTASPLRTGSKPVLLPVPQDAEPIPPVPPPPTSSYYSASDDLPPLAEDPALALESEEPEFPALTEEVELPALPLDSSPRELKFNAINPPPSADRLNPFSRLDQPEVTTEEEEEVDLPQLDLPESSQEDESDAGTASISPEEDPFAVREKEFVAPPLDDPNSQPAPLAIPSFDESKPALIPVDEGTGSESDAGLTNSEETYTEKMEKIRSRFGMKGLKGFCPVTLKDKRELRDAKPENHASFRGQKFHFATPEARDRFNENPAFYAPAAYGADVVALGRDHDVVEGTLDYAAWYKGKLYLFGNQANYETFVKSPAEYLTSAGTE